jgi:hypothetical protein
MNKYMRRESVSAAQWDTLVSAGCFGVSWRTRHTLFGVSIPEWLAGIIIRRAFRARGYIARWFLWHLSGRAGLVLFLLPRRAWARRALVLLE